MTRESEDHVREVLFCIDPNCERERWWRIAAGVMNGLGRAGFDLFDEWSSMADSYEAAATRNTYRSFSPDGGITFATVVRFAKEEGYVVGRRSKFKHPTAEERATRKDLAAARNRIHGAADAKEKAEAQSLAQSRWKVARAATGDHPYLKAKGVKPHGLRVGSWTKFDGRTGKFIELDRVLLVPIMDRNGAIHSLQGITASGGKLYLSGGAKKANFYLIGGNPKKNDAGQLVFHFAEGFATAASGHECSGQTTFCCFDVGNIPVVVRAVRAAHRDAELVMLADNDAEAEIEGKGNPGMKMACELGMELDVRVAIPPPGDFNDLMLAEGPNAVRAAVAAALVPTEPYSSVGAAASRYQSHRRQGGR